MIWLEVYSGSLSNVVTLIVIVKMKPRYFIKSVIIVKKLSKYVFTIRKTRENGDSVVIISN